MCRACPSGYQIGQKLHACTEVTLHKENDRFRNLIDLLLLGKLEDDGAWARTRAACEEVFGLRRKQSWPPAVTVFQDIMDEFSARKYHCRACHRSAISAADADAAVLDELRRMILPRAAFEAAREELRRRLALPSRGSSDELRRAPRATARAPEDAIRVGRHRRR